MQGEQASKTRLSLHQPLPNGVKPRHGHPWRNKVGFNDLSQYHRQYNISFVILNMYGTQFKFVSEHEKAFPGCSLY